MDAVAASGNILAIGGRIRYDNLFGVQFYRLSDLRLIGHRSQLPAPVSALKFSPDGDVLAVGMVGGRGLAFFSMRNGSQIAADPGYKGQVQWIDIAADGHTVTSGEDGRIRLYGPDHGKIAEMVLPNGGHPYAVTFAPDGRSIAVGVQNRALVWLLDAATLRPLGTLAGAAGHVGGLGIVAFTRDGEDLLAAGTYKAGTNSPRLVRRWTLRTGRAVEFEAGGDTITDLVATADGIVLSDAEPILSRLDGTGRLTVSRAANHIDFRDAGLSGFAVSYDGGAIELPLARGGAEPVFDVHLRTLSLSVSGTQLQRPREAAGGMEVTRWRNLAIPRVNGRGLALEPDERSLAAAVAPDGSGAAFGTNFYVRYVRRDGTSWHVLIPSPAWAVNVSGNGSRVVAGLGDGTVRWFDAATGNALLTLFVEPVHRHWVLSTPEGFFDHDNATPGQPDGRSLIGYRFNDPSAQVSRFVETGQLYPIYYRPDLVGLALNNNPAAGAALRQAQFRQGAIETVLTRGLPAHLELQEACGMTNIPADPHCHVGQAIVSVHAGASPGLRIFTNETDVLVRFRLNNVTGTPGSALISRNGAHVEPMILSTSEDNHSRVETVLISLGDGLNTIRLLPLSANKEIEGSDQAAVTFSVVRSQPGRRRELDRRKLFVLSVGISRYSLPSMALPNARNDAVAVADLMTKPDPPVYDTVQVTALNDEQATVSGITAAIQAIADKATPDDMVMIFFAGHGEEVDGHYYFAPADFGTRNPDLTRTWAADGPTSDQALDELFRKEGLGHDALVSLLQQIKASRVAIVLDTCYSGATASQDMVSQRNMNDTMTGALSHGAGRIVLSGATEEAQDAPTDPAYAARNGKDHGLFTGYLLDALQGGAANPREDTIDVDDLAKFTKQMVKRVSTQEGRPQEPAFYFEGNDFFALRSAKGLPGPLPALYSSQSH